MFLKNIHKYLTVRPSSTYVCISHISICFTNHFKQLQPNIEEMFLGCRALTTFKLEGEVTSLSESSQGEVRDNREKWEDFWEK